ncbi:thiamine-phosphate kinase, partial [Shewanella sp. SR41-2]|nr:thiamine-phosphate kinase [Shewanella sp. SR41-2]
SIKANLSHEDALSYALTGGEDYELLFTVPESQRCAIDTALIHAGVKFVKIGQISAGDKLKLVENGLEFNPISRGFVHF